MIVVSHDWSESDRQDDWDENSDHGECGEW